jgi:hypothetical protein
MRNEFIEFRNCYSEYLQEYNGLKFLKDFIADADVSKNIKEIAILSHKLCLLFIRLRLQLHDTFVDQKEKVAYIKSVRDFALMEISEWEKREPHAKKYEWASHPHREWMPNCLYDILKEVKKVEGKPDPESKKEKSKKEDSLEKCLTNEGVTLLPKLIKEFQNREPRQMACLWVTMNNLGLITENVGTSSEIWKLLNSRFGDIGTVQNFTISLKKLKNIQLPQQQHLYDQIDDYTGIIRDLQLT